MRFPRAVLASVLVALMTCSCAKKTSGPADLFPAGSTLLQDLPAVSPMNGPKAVLVLEVLGRLGGFEDVTEIRSILGKERDVIDVRRDSGDLKEAHYQAALYRKNLERVADALANMAAEVKNYYDTKLEDIETDQRNLHIFTPDMRYMPPPSKVADEIIKPGIGGRLAALKSALHTSAE